MSITSMEMLNQLVGSVGFPIVAYLLMFRLARNTIKENTKALQEVKHEIKELQD